MTETSRMYTLAELMDMPRRKPVTRQHRQGGAVLRSFEGIDLTAL